MALGNWPVPENLNGALDARMLDAARSLDTTRLLHEFERAISPRVEMMPDYRRFVEQLAGDVSFHRSVAPDAAMMNEGSQTTQEMRCTISDWPWDPTLLASSLIGIGLLR
jgi:hypothetical protein